MRAEFEVYRKDVEVETRSGKKQYKFYPLSGEEFPIFMEVVSKFPQGDNLSNEDFFKALDSDTTRKLHTLISATLKYSLSITDKKDLEELDRFVSQNLFAFLPALMDVNLGSGQE